MHCVFISFFHSPSILLRFSQDSSCTKTLVATGNKNNLCYVKNGGSHLFEYPYAYKYSDTSCSGTAETESFGGNFCNFTTGVDDDDDDFAKDNSYRSIILVSIPSAPPGQPTANPTVAPTSLCESTPCPTTCPAGYGAAESYPEFGCTFYCSARPTENQCQPGGPGCTSSCTPCAQLFSSMCPTSCPNGFIPGTEWPNNNNGCSVFCLEKPNGECAIGGSGCNSSCYPSNDSSPSSNLSAGAIAGIAIGSVVGLMLVVMGVMWVMKVGLFIAKAPLSKWSSFRPGTCFGQ
jgi:hypothetical protein